MTQEWPRLVCTQGGQDKSKMYSLPASSYWELVSSSVFMLDGSEEYASIAGRFLETVPFISPLCRYKKHFN